MRQYVVLLSFACLALTASAAISSWPVQAQIADNPDMPAPLRNPRHTAPGMAPPVPLETGEVLSAPAPHPRETAALPWTDEELDGEGNRCDVLLEEPDLSYEFHMPLREGRCGAPLPIKLISIGRDPVVRVNGPAIMTCEMAARLSRWMRRVVQPEAFRLLGARITELTSVAAYVCRNRYDDGSRPVSEHALANALDIAAFETTMGNRITVLGDWGPAGKDIPLPLRKPTLAQRGLVPPPETGTISEPARTSGPITQAPEPPPEPEAQPSPPDPNSQFLHSLHAGACKIFGTVLGPDANAAHQDHLHLDMAERRYGSFCQ